MRRNLAERLSADDWYVPMLKLCIELVNQPDGRPTDQSTLDLVDAHALAKKATIHLISLRRMCEAVPPAAYPAYTPLPSEGPIDHSSASVLLRAAFETYLTLSLLYLRSDNEELRCRRISWKIGGLQYRQGLEPLHELDIRKRAGEAHKLEGLLGVLTASAYFRALNHKRREKLKAGDWKFGLSWLDLAEMAGFNRHLFQKIYGYLCAYAHSSYLTVVQISSASNQQDQRFLADFVLHMALPLMAKLILQYPRLFPESMSLCHCSPFAFRAARIHDPLPAHYPDRN
ncbi:MAG: hypothetical protein ITG07_07355 [Candidimonas sp.]|nr:hypothetical protein [Candidimonas sp.]